MNENKAWTIYKTLESVLAQLTQTETPMLYNNVAVAVSSAKDLLASILNPSG